MKRKALGYCIEEKLIAMNYLEVGKVRLQLILEKLPLCNGDESFFLTNYEKVSMKNHNLNQHMNISSDFINIAKAFAIFSVLCAHSVSVPDYFSVSSKITSQIIQSIGSFGVSLFFLVSGYLFSSINNKNITFFYFIKNKMERLIIPWFVSSFMVYIYIALRKSGSLFGFTLFFIGFMSSYWFLTVLVLMYIVYFFLYHKIKRMKFVYGLAFLTLISRFFIFIGYIPRNSLGVYLNIFNWTLFFSLGILLKYLSADDFLKVLFKSRYITLILSIVAYFFFGSYGTIFYYSRVEYVPIALLAIVTVAGWSKSIEFSKVKPLFILIGKYSFSIYLYHQLLWAGLVSFWFNLFDVWYLIPLRPIIVLILTLSQQIILIRISKRFNKGNMVGWILGFSSRK